MWETGLDEVPGEEDDEEQTEDMELMALGVDTSCASSTLNTCFSCFLCQEREDKSSSSQEHCSLHGRGTFLGNEAPYCLILLLIPWKGY